MSPDIGILAERRGHLLRHLHDELGVEAVVPGTKDHPVVQQLFEAEAVNLLLDKVVALEDRVLELESAKPKPRPKKKAAPAE